MLFTPLPSVCPLDLWEAGTTASKVFNLPSVLLMLFPKCFLAHGPSCNRIFSVSDSKSLLHVLGWVSDCRCPWQPAKSTPTNDCWVLAPCPHQRSPSSPPSHTVAQGMLSQTPLGFGTCEIHDFGIVPMLLARTSGTVHHFSVETLTWGMTLASSVLQGCEFHGAFLQS